MWVSDSYEDLTARARSQMARGDVDGALESYKRLSDRLARLKPSLLDRRPQLRGLYGASLAQQANIHRVQGNFEQALALYGQLGETSPEQGRIWRQLAALTHIDMGQAEKGLDELRAEAVAAPGNYDIWLVIGIECGGLGRNEEAEEHLRRAIKNAATPEAQRECYLALFDFCRAQGRVEDAIVAWNQAWETDGGEPDYIFPVYQMLAENGQMERAREYLARETNPLRRGLYEGLLDAEQGNTQQAEKAWKRVARMQPLKFDHGHEAWAEAALRAHTPPRNVVGILEQVWRDGAITSRGLVVLAIAEAGMGHADHAGQALQAACSIGQQQRPRSEKLSESNWVLFEEMVSDDDIKRQLHHFFETAPDHDPTS